MAAEWKKVIVSGSQAELAGVTGSFTGSFKGDGSQLTGLPQGGSGTFISSGSLTGSFTPDTAGGLTAFKIQSGSDVNQKTLLTVSSSGMVSAGTSLSGSFAVGGLSGSRGFLKDLYTALGGTFGNGQVTYNANDIKSWKDADTLWDSSLLRNYIDETTPISDILYFLLRPYAGFYQFGSANPAIFSSTTIVQNGSITAPTSIPFVGNTGIRVPQGTTTDATVNTYTTYGFHQPGSLYLAQLTSNVLDSTFPSVTRGTAAMFSNLYWSVSSVRNANGATSVNQSNALAFGLGDKTPGSGASTVTDFYLSASFSYRRRTLGTAVNNLPAYTVTSTSGSGFLTSVTNITSTPNAQGLYFNNVPDTANQFNYQDGYFQAAPLGQAFKLTANPNINTANLEALGIYEVTASVWIASSSIAGQQSPWNSGSNGARELYQSAVLIPSALTGFTPTFNAPAQDTNTIALILGSIASSSLSGAPYVTSASYAISQSVTNAFGPLYPNSATIYTTPLSAPSNPNLNVQSNAPASFGVDTNTGQYNAAAVGYVFDSAGTTARSAGQIPTHNDLIKISYPITVTAIGAITETNALLSSNAVASPTTTVTGGTITRINTSDFALNTLSRALILAGDTPAGTMAGQQVMAWRRRSPGYQNRATATNLSETFLCESQRLIINDNILAFSTVTNALWPTTFAGQANCMTTKDLQQKPGGLVWPGGTFGYWIADPGTFDGFKYYATYFSLSSVSSPSSQKSQLTVQVAGGGGIVPWVDTSALGTGVAVLIQSYQQGGYWVDPTFIDIANTVGSEWPQTTSGINPANGQVSAGTAGLNPFGQTIRIQPNGLQGNANTIPLFTNIGRVITPSIQPNVLVLLRMKGNTTAPITNITVSIV